MIEKTIANDFEVLTMFAHHHIATLDFGRDDHEGSQPPPQPIDIVSFILKSHHLMHNNSND